MGLASLFVLGDDMISCVWDTVQNWADLAGQDPELYLAFRFQGGDTYFRDCGVDVLMNETMFLAIAGV